MNSGLNPTPDDSNAELADLRAEIDQVERRALRRIEPGVRAMVVACAVLILIIAALLPWVAGISGWQLLSGAPTPVRIDILPRVFGFGAFAFAILGSAVALGLRLWGIAWMCALGCGAFTVIGLLSVWSQQSTASHQPGPGPGAGLILAVVSMLVLAVTWARIVWSRPGGVFADRAG